MCFFHVYDSGEWSLQAAACAEHNRWQNIRQGWVQRENTVTITLTYSRMLFPPEYGKQKIVWHWCTAHDVDCLLEMIAVSKQWKKEEWCKIHQRETELIFISDKASHLLFSKLTQPHSKPSLRLIPLRGTERRAYSCGLPSRRSVLAATVAPASASQPAERFSLGCFLPSLWIEPDWFSLHSGFALISTSTSHALFWPAGFPEYDFSHQQ